MSADTLGRARPGIRLPLGGLAAFATAILLLAGIIHICAILLVPMVAPADGWSRLAAFAGEDQFAEVPASGAGGGSVIGLDPLFVNGACRLSLAEAPAGIAVEARERFWSLAIYNPRGTIIFSLNDRTAVNGRLDMTVVNPAQNAALRLARPAEFEQSIVVESDSDDLIALLRLFAPTATAQAEARRIMAGTECLPAPVEAAEGASGG